MRLVRPSMKWENEHRSYLVEWGPTRIIPSSFNLEGTSSYEEYLQELLKREKGYGEWLPCSNYFLVSAENRILGLLDIRHELNDFLYRIGGHIGYSVRPSERKKGFATFILSEALHKCRELGMDKVLITCDDDNIGSAKVIIHNGGIEDHSEQDSNGIVKRRFWINL
ncbi:GNAT family N-acetyltransferase [Paucisalibacillus sp. EB02]|uniref:GNAT family N-acetyltransferase n=1 Tax=Paucisalibacillus sp. EB02 TaxID=1347087 RepID=UPI0004BB8FC0|nr:GNAT family N-acetyltransferase [Paucisalibacillus sp. EB02]